MEEEVGFGPMGGGKGTPGYLWLFSLFCEHVGYSAHICICVCLFSCCICLSIFMGVGMSVYKSI